jgi:hypothetical protein
MAANTVFLTAKGKPPSGRLQLQIDVIRHTHPSQLSCSPGLCLDCAIGLEETKFKCPLGDRAFACHTCDPRQLHRPLTTWLRHKTTILSQEHQPSNCWVSQKHQPSNCWSAKSTSRATVGSAKSTSRATVGSVLTVTWYCGHDRKRASKARQLSAEVSLR